METPNRVSIFYSHTVMNSFGKIADRVNCPLVGNDRLITAIGEAANSRENELIFIIQKNSLRNKNTIQSKAWVINRTLFDSELEDYLARNEVSYIVTDDPYEVFVRILRLFYPESPRDPFLHPTAVIDKTAVYDKSLYLGAYGFIGAHSSLGNRVTIHGHCYIGDKVRIDDNTLIYPHVTVYDNCEIGKNVIIHAGTVIGSDGFGFYKKDSSHHKIPHIGKVVIEDDVEIGANCTIDRGTLGETRIKRGTKIDNLVQIAHNVIIGENSLIAAQTGIAGSTIIGNHVTIAGQAGIVGHITIGNHVTIGAQSGVISSIEDGQTVSGYPARNHTESLRKEAYIKKIPEILKMLREKNTE